MFREKPETDQLVIDLSGPDGNAFVLLAIAAKLSGRFGLDKEKVMEEMKSGDYENLLRVMDNYFDNFIIFER